MTLCTHTRTRSHTFQLQMTFLTSPSRQCPNMIHFSPAILKKILIKSQQNEANLFTGLVVIVKGFNMLMCWVGFADNISSHFNSSFPFLGIEGLHEKFKPL